MKKIFIIVGIIAILVLFSAIFLSMPKDYGNKLKSENVLIPIKIGYRTQDFYGPLFVGIEKGIFEKYGLVVEPVEFNSTNQITDAMIAGRIDASVGGVNTFLIFNIQDKNPGYLKIFSLSMEDSEHPSSALVVSCGSTLKIRDLNNKKMASHIGSSIKIMYERLIKANNLQNTTLMQMDPKLELPALQTGQVDAVFLLEPFITIGKSKNIGCPLELAIFDKYFMKNIPLAASIVSQKFINENPEAVKRLVKATDESIGVIVNDPNELRRVLPIYTATDSEVASQMPIAPFVKYSEMSKEKLTELSKLLLEIGEIKNLVNIEDIILSDKYVTAD